MQQGGEESHAAASLLTPPPLPSPLQSRGVGEVGRETGCILHAPWEDSLGMALGAARPARASSFGRSTS